MPIASKLLYFQRRPSPAPPDPGPEPPDPRRRASRDPSARQRRRSSLSSHHNPGQEPVPGNQRDSTKSLGPAGNTAEHVAGISSITGLSRSVSDHGRLPDAVQQARERLLQRLNSVDLSGRRQKTCPSETIWSDFSSDCILGTLTNCFQPGDSIAASKVEGATEPVGSNADERTPISPFSEPTPEIQHSVCNGAAEEGDDRTCEPPAECSICLERCGGADDGLTQLRCRHVFHWACLERWLRSRGDCPYCRATVARS
ncbi:uncharacterized protein C2845_PM06G32300 [Panicum miliaceum]|uniref:RING-type domain-containing protein n=1 Tax=Panicum miliaceum TaxID=4540 RepID=A0A3L6RBF0_PANMI|nr:uncharacterized protein C2845_PM06G32300 [Panicum miliaceum]